MAMFIYNPKSLAKSIRKYNLSPRSIQSTAGRGECSRTLICITFARRGSGVRSDRSRRNERIAVLTLKEALPFWPHGMKVEAPSKWLIQAAR